MKFYNRETELQILEKNQVQSKNLSVMTHEKSPKLVASDFPLISYSAKPHQWLYGK